jgi:uncharacterized membrane protein
MENSSMTKAYKITRAITIAFAILGLVAIFAVALIINLNQDGWWHIPFGATLVMSALFFGAIYVSLLMILAQITHYLHAKSDSTVKDNIFTKILRFLVGITSVVSTALSVYGLAVAQFSVGGFYCGIAVIGMYIILGAMRLLNTKKRIFKRK